MLSGVLIPQSETCTQSKDRFLTNAPSVILTRMCHVSILFALTLLLTAFASAQTLTGIVKNATTGKPSAGDEVVLLKLGEGMEEAGRTKTDSGGHFTFKLDDAQAPHLVRAIHQEVTYHRMAPPGTTSVELEVYDAAKKIEGISVVADIMRVQADRGQLIVVREFGVQNSSKPPRTQMDEHNLEFNVPGGAQIISRLCHSHHGRRKPAQIRARAGRRERSLFVHLPAASRAHALRSRVSSAILRKRQHRPQIALSARALRGDDSQVDAVYRQQRLDWIQAHQLSAGT